MLELPGQRRVRFFNTRPPLSPPLSVSFVWFGCVLCCWPFLSVACFVCLSLCFSLSVFLLFFPFGVLESSDQGRVRILNTSLPPPFLFSTAKLSCPGIHSVMSLLSREQVTKSWYEKNPNISFFDLLYAIEQHKSISTEYGLNVSIEQHWRFGDPHKKTAAPDRHDYEIATVDGSETLPGPDWHKLYRWLVSQSSAFLPYHTVYLVTDNRDLQSDKVKSVPGLSHWPMVAAWWKERLRYVGPYGELTTVVFVHISADTGLHKVHPTWAGTYILDACVFLFPTINFALIDSDCVPVTLFEIRELWLASTDPTLPATPSKVAKSKLPSPIASSHKRARSVDTGRDMQQPGPPST